MSATVTVSRRNHFSAVPDAILTDARLSLKARAILAYLVGRPDGWTVFVAHIQRTLGISEAIWRSARRELQACGYFEQRRTRGEGGKWVWTHLVHDEPITPPTIPKKSMDGDASHGEAIHGEPQDRARGLKQRTRNNTTRERGAAPPPPRAPARELSGEGDVEAEGPRPKPATTPAPASRQGASPPVPPVGGRYQETTGGILFTPGNAEDAAALARIGAFPPEQVARAIDTARARDPRGRAFPAAILRGLLRPQETTGQGQADVDAFLAGLEEDARKEAASLGVAAPSEAGVVEGSFFLVGD